MRNYGTTSVEFSVVIAVYNNAATLVELYSRLKSVFLSGGFSFEVVFVDDSSSDGSVRVLDQLAGREEGVTVLTLKQNVGQHIAVLTGLSKSRGKWCVVMDADLQDPPEAIPALLRTCNNGVDAVFAGRRGNYESRGRLLTSRLFKLLLHLLCGVPRDAGIFVLMSRRMVNALLSMPTSTPWIVSMIGCTGLRATSVPVKRAPRTEGRSGYSSFARLRTAARGIICVLEYKFWRAKNPYPCP
jgi:glycosyltransferase involved in cell wall biosynthesis